ncbi:peptidoglycan-associated lipoprotein Pal [Palleronia sp. LCG004]|uniref:peptidoglycan-associated lipoprotein Pal n=1 Tax=Palleronia sp. LCG004 TaxID=3079304 RepID=UPI0029437AD2|nr:peptidoglycan-associated lipoprotein Pal [Palleronia sp. LCG004]WOI55846.1 peptidoglycan-associated lipoprotein Pal [Palleronia sp. LCG004]
MKVNFAAVALTAILGLAACSSPDRFGPGGPGDAAGLYDPNNPGFGSGNVTSGPLDPSSPQYFNQTVGDRVLFAVDQSTISPEARSTLVGQANWLNANPGYTAIIEGHADEQGTREYNLALGERRASSARDFLVSQGVSSSRLQTVTYGKERPIEVCSTESCYAQNRRAVTVIAAGAPLS